MTKVLGLTGGIATGKSTVTQIFKDYHVPVISADQVARQVVTPDSPALQEIVATFGEQYLTANGELNRRLLGQLVFANSKRLAQLNQIMQPRIRQEMWRQVTTIKKKQRPRLIVLEIPLLFEQHREHSVDYVMVVSTSTTSQLRRLMTRNHYDRQEALDRIHSQLPLAQKRQRADVVIDNAGSVEQTRQQVVKWLENQKLI